MIQTSQAHEHPLFNKYVLDDDNEVAGVVVGFLTETQLLVRSTEPGQGHRIIDMDDWDLGSMRFYETLEQAAAGAEHWKAQ